MMLATINEAVLPALRIAATFFLIVNIVGGTYIFRNRHPFFDRDPDVDDDIPAVRKLRVEVVMFPWIVLTTLLLILLIYSGLLNRGAVHFAALSSQHRRGTSVIIGVMV